MAENAKQPAQNDKLNAEEYPDLKGGKVKLDGDSVIEFHELPEMQQVTLKVLRREERDKRLIIKRGPNGGVNTW